MPEPIQEQILADLETSITAIGGGTYYNTLTANNVVRADGAAIEAENGPFPFVVIAGLDSRPLDELFAGAETYVDELIEVQVLGFIASRTDVHRDLRRLEHDIRKAIWTDPTRNGLAVVTMWRGTELFYPLNNESLAQVIVHLDVQYQVQLSDLTATIGS